MLYIKLLKLQVSDFISKFQKNRKVYCARLQRPHQRANTTSTGTRSRPCGRPTMTTRGRRDELTLGKDFEEIVT